MKKTQHWCDVMSLGPPDGLFMTYFQDALQVIAENAKGKQEPIIVRMMFGNIVGMPVNCNRVIKVLTQKIPYDANIRLWVGAWRRGVSWNHAKIVAVDGRVSCLLPLLVPICAMSFVLYQSLCATHHFKPLTTKSIYIREDTIFGTIIT